VTDVIDRILTDYLQAIWPVDRDTPWPEGLRSAHDAERLRNLLQSTVEKATAGLSLEPAAKCFVVEIKEKPEIVCFGEGGISLVTYDDACVETLFLGWPRTSLLRTRALFETTRKSFGEITILGTDESPPLRILFDDWNDHRFEPLFELLAKKLQRP